MADRLLYLGIVVVFIIVTHSPTSSGALNSTCSSDTNCTDVNAYCGTQNKCVCKETIEYIDTANTCQQKVDLGETCPSTSITAPCSDLLASCQDNTCVCNTGYSNSNDVCVTDCGSNITTVAQGNATVTSTTLGSTAAVTCTTGYTNPNHINITCQFNGTWTSAFCSLIECGSNITTVAQGNTTVTTTTFGSTAAVACTTGYTNPNPLNITCQSNGTWASATCSPIDCGSNITTVAQGNATVTSTTFGSTAAVTCFTDYTIPNPINITCQSNGTWTSATCSPINCDSNITTVAQGNTTVTTTTFGSTAAVTCTTGYTNPNPLNITCQSNGTWTSATCSPIDCGSNITTVAQGNTTVTSTAFGSTAAVTCTTGYTNPNPINITCQSNGTWTSATCFPIDCGSSPSDAVTAGTATLTTPGSTTYRSTASVNCNNGYTTSTTQISCQSNGQWSTAVCSIKNCDSSPSNAVTAGTATLTTPGSTTYQSTASVNCNTGYTTSTTQISCQSNGQWLTAVCSIKNCDSSPSDAVTAGTATLTTPGSTTYQSTASVNCNTGYTTSTTQISCQSNGQWLTAVCSIKNCDSSPSDAVTAGTATLTTPGSTTYQSTASVNCNTGYTTSTTQISCQSNGQWLTAVCSIKNCDSSPSDAVTAGTATLTTPGSTTYQSTASVNCNTGYTTSTTQISCQSNGQWLTAVCSIKNCGSSPSDAVTAGTATLTTPGSTTYQSKASVNCNTGYTTSTTQIFCQSNGKWSTAVCSIKNCGYPVNTVTRGSAVPDSSSTYGSTATVSCNIGYENPSPQKINCQSNGAWSTAACSIKDCGPPPPSAVTDGTASLTTQSSTTYLSTANVNCNTGYTTTTSQITCQANGQWSTSDCTIRDCEGLSNPANGLVSYGQTTYNAVATYTCNVGYIIDGTTSNTITRTCTATGIWSGNPICSVKANPLGAVCPNPSDTNVQPGNLCNGDNAFCMSRSASSAEYTCQCNTAFYDDNGNDIAGSCQPVWNLRVEAIAFSSITTSSMVVSWTPPTNKHNFISGYIVEWREKSNSVQGSFSPVTTSTNSTISSSLTPGRAYTVKVITRNVVDYTSTVKTTFLAKEQALKPAMPGAIVKTSSDLNAVDKKIYVAWTASTGDVSGYEWQLQEGSTVLQSGTAYTASTDIGYTDFKNGYRYNMSIIALSQRFDGNNVVKSETRTEEIKTVVTVPDPPTSVQCHMTTDTSVTIKWIAPQLPNGELVEYKVDTYTFTDNNKLKTDMTGNVNLMYESTGLQPGSYYTFDVSTVNERYTSTTARLQDTYCATRANVSEMPNDLNVSDLQSRSFVVTWTKPSRTYGENMGYIVQVRTADDTCVMELIRTCTTCTQTFNSSNLENMCASTVSTTDQQTKTLIDGDAAQSYNVTGLNPDVSYTVTVTAVNDAGRGKIASITVQTEEEVPQKPKDVVLSDLTSTSCNVTWTIDGPRPGDTTFDVIVTAVSPVSDYSIQLTGFNQRRQALSGLQEYWMYNVSVRATTSKGSVESDPTPFTTLPAAPGRVDGFEVMTTPGGSTVQVQWKLPVLLERNSEITMFTLEHNTSTDMNAQRETKNRNIDDDTYLYQVMLNVTPEVTYQFKVFAINVGNENGEETEKVLEAPAGIPLNIFEDTDNKEVIQKDAIVASQYTIGLSIDTDFYEQKSQGLIKFTGLIGCAKDKCSGNEIGENMNLDGFQTLPNWHESSKDGFSKYRITRDNWRDQQSQNSRKRRAAVNIEEYIVGSETCNETMQNQYCNGPLEPATSYIIHVVICTSGGCLISNEYGPFITLAVPPEDKINTTVIIIAVVVSVVVIAVVVVVAIFVVRRRKAPPKMTRMEPEVALVEEGPNSSVQRKRPIKLSEFEDHLSDMHKDSNLKFSSAYDDLRSIAPTHPQEAANREENRLKNRYINILPFDHSRVKLFSNGEEESSDYINANYLPGYTSPREYIGCQGPIPGTIDDFWRMVWEQNVSIIVMLTLCKEGQKVKCEQYWPDETNEPKQYGDVIVEVNSNSTIQTYVMRIFKITNAGKTRTVKHFHFLSWLDFQANVKHDIILDFLTHVRTHVQPPDKVGPMIVHCSAGVGRTGTYVCLDHLMQLIEEHDFNVSIDIFDMVLKLRDNRPLMVQTEQQYVFIHDCVKELMNRKRKAMENIYENQGFNKAEDIYENTQEPSLYENVQMKTEL